MNRISENQPSLLDAANGVTMENDAQARLNIHDEPTRNPIEDLPVAYVEFNAQGTIIYANSIARSLHCNKGDELIGKSAWDIMAADQIDLSRKAFMAIMESGKEPPVIQRALYTQNGEYRTYEMFRSLIRDEQGHPTGLRYVYIDITKAQSAREEAQQTHQFMKSILESLSEVVIVIDSIGFVRLANQAAEEFTGLSAAEMFGRQIEECLMFVSYEMDSDENFSLSAALGKSYAGRTVIRDSKKQKVQMEINTSPIVDKKHEYSMGVVITLRMPNLEPR
jgi:PAS domain S-box-containing protein